MRLLLLLPLVLAGCAHTRITYVLPDGTSITYYSDKDVEGLIVLPDGTRVEVSGTASTVESARWELVRSLAEAALAKVPGS